MITFRVIGPESANVPRRYLRLCAPISLLLALLLRLVVPAPLDMGLAVLLVVVSSGVGCCVACWYMDPRKKSDRAVFLVDLLVINGISLAVFADCGLKSADSIFMGVLILGGIGCVVTICVGALSMVVSGRLLDKYRMFPRKGFCLRCGYDLRGSQSNRCPECGTVIVTPGGDAAQEQSAEDDSSEKSETAKNGMNLSRK